MPLLGISGFPEHEKDLMMKHDVAKHFWQKVVVEPGCWGWKAGLTSDGYGQFHALGQYRAHRVSWILHYGLIPSTRCVLHRCGNRRCANPRHLYLGDHKDNARDRAADGHTAHNWGEACGQAKLKNGQIREIRRRALNGETQADIARRFSVDQSSISYIVRRKTWPHINP